MDGFGNMPRTRFDDRGNGSFDDFTTGARPCDEGSTTILTHAAQSASKEIGSQEGPGIRWNELDKSFLMEDAQVIARSNRRFCRRFVEVLAKSGRVRFAHVDLGRHRLALEFLNRTTSRAEAARLLGEAIRLAAIPVSEPDANALVSAHSWDACIVFADESSRLSSWWWTDSGQGRIRLNGSRLTDPEIDPRRWPDLIPGLKSARPKGPASGVSILVNSRIAEVFDVVERIDALHRLIAEHSIAWSDRPDPTSLNLSARFMHLGLAGASFFCAVVGFALPGVPTVPFVLLTTYHLSRGSRRAHQCFLQLPLFGTLGQDWASGRFIRPANKILLIFLTTAIVVVTLTLTNVTPGTLMIVATAYLISAASVMVSSSRPLTDRLPRITPSGSPRMLPV